MLDYFLSDLVLGHSELNPQWWITIYNKYHPKPSQHAHPATHTTTTNTNFLAVLPTLPFGSVCGLGSCFSLPPLFSVPQHRGFESSAAWEQNKTMESVRHSKANGFTAASSPPSLFMCKSIHRVLMAPAMHEKKFESFTHLQSWQKTIQEGCIESVFFISIWCKCLCTGLMRPVMALVWFW